MLVPKPDDNRNWFDVFGPWVIALCVIAVYARSFHVPFLFDDHGAILENPNIRQLWPLTSAAWAPPDLPVSGRPVAALSLAVNYAIGGYEVVGYHVFNLLVHLGNALLVFGMLRRSIRAGNPRRASGIALAIALLWAVHPLISEAVVYVIQRTELLVSFFFLASFYTAIRGFTTDAPRRRRWHAVAIATAMLAVLSKEIAVALPPLVLLYDRAFVSGSLRGAWTRHRMLHVGLFSTWILLAALLVTVSRGRSVGFELGVAWSDYLLTQAGVLLFYLRSCFVPTDLSLAHDWPVVRSFAAGWPSVAAMTVLLVAGLVCVVRAPRAGFVAMWFFLILAPTSSVVPIATEIAAERRMYLPLLAVLVTIATAIVAAVNRIAAHQRAPGRPSTTNWLTAGVALACFGCLGSLGWLTAQRVDQFDTAVRIWEDAVAKNPEGRTARNNLGHAYQADGRFDDARAEYERAIELAPGDPLPRMNLGGLLGRQGDLDGAERELLRARDLDPAAAAPLVNLGNLASLRRNYPDAVRFYCAALERDANRVSAHVNLAFAYEQLRRYEEAQQHLRRSLTLHRDNARLHAELGLFLARRGEFDRAKAALAEATRLEPDNPEHRNHLDTVRDLAARPPRAR